MTIDPERFRAVMGTFATGCTIVTFPSEPLHGMTANAISSVSLDPPLCLVCVDHGTTSYELLSAGSVDAFAINILSTEQRDLAEHFANMRELDRDPFEDRPTKTVVSDAPVFTRSVAYLDCSVETAHPAGDHTIYVGRVRAGDSLSEAADPLTFFEGNWGTIREL